MIAQLIIGAWFGAAVLGTDEGWVKFLSGIGAIVLTFLAGAELDPIGFQAKWKEATAVGLVGFIFPFLGCAAAAAQYGLGWEVMPSWLAGVAHVDHIGRGGLRRDDRIRLQHNRIRQDGADGVLHHGSRYRACARFDFCAIHLKTLIFIRTGAVVVRGAAVVDAAVLSPVSAIGLPRLEIKFLLICLMGLGALPSWADSEAVLPAYIIGMVLAGTVGKDHALIRRLRTLTFGLLTPFYFIRAGAFVSIPALIAAPFAFIFMLLVKIGTKFVGVYPVDANSTKRLTGGHVHDALDVHRADFRHDFVAVRSVTRHYQPGSIFDFGRRA